MELEKQILPQLETIGLPTIKRELPNGKLVLLFNLDDSFKFLDFCDTQSINVLGADGFEILKDGIRPNLAFIYDASTTEMNREFMMKDTHFPITSGVK
jgi:hypothetical protein